MRRTRAATEALCVLDSGGLTALVGRSQRARAWFRWVVGRTDDGIDALVAATAVESGAPCVLLTSDPGDLGRLLADEARVAVTRV